MKRSTISILVALTVAVGSAPLFFLKCKAADPVPSNTTPDGAILGATACLRDNDIKGLLERVRPPEDYAKMKEKFAGKPKMSDSDKAGFNAVLTQLTAENAEDTIYGLIKPKLAEAQGSLADAKDGIPDMIQGLVAMQGITDEADLKAAQEMATAIGKWVATLKIDNEATAKKAIGIVCTTARSLKIKSADDLEALTFDQILDKAGMSLAGLKQVLDLYGLSINDSLDSVKVGKPEIAGDTATVPVTSTLLGRTMTLPAKLKKSGDCWYGKLPK